MSRNEDAFILKMQVGQQSVQTKDNACARELVRTARLRLILCSLRFLALLCFLALCLAQGWLGPGLFISGIEAFLHPLGQMHWL